jgi:hypothetical protein
MFTPTAQFHHSYNKTVNSRAYSTGKTAEPEEHSLDIVVMMMMMMMHVSNFRNRGKI